MIKHYHVQNFKNLWDTEANFEQLNVIIGPNSAGKSSLLQSIDFLKAFMVSSIDYYLATHHIAHIGDGNTRRAAAQKFAQYLRDTANNEAPWSLTNLDWSDDYIRRAPGVSVRIWSTDEHLLAYRHEAPEIGRRTRI